MATKKAKMKSKMDIATQLFKKYYGKKSRAEIVNIFVEKSGFIAFLFEGYLRFLDLSDHQIECIGIVSNLISRFDIYPL